MNKYLLPYTIFPIGDNAVTIEFGNTINDSINKEVINRFHQIQGDPIPGVIDVFPSYSSITLYYDLLKVKKNGINSATAFETIKKILEARMLMPVIEHLTEPRLVKIPVCYETEFAPDLHQFLIIKNITKEELIEIHTATIYKVFMIGFLPGFAYMGEVNEKIVMPRKSKPKMVAAGSVGIAGKQTGIYPLISPGGWQIIGRTPLKIFDPGQKEEILLRTGDHIQFYSISKIEYADY